MSETSGFSKFLPSFLRKRPEPLPSPPAPVPNLVTQSFDTHQELVDTEVDAAFSQARKVQKELASRISAEPMENILQRDAIPNSLDSFPQTDTLPESSEFSRFLDSHHERRYAIIPSQRYGRMLFTDEPFPPFASDVSLTIAYEPPRTFSGGENIEYLPIRHVLVRQGDRCVDLARVWLITRPDGTPNNLGLLPLDAEAPRHIDLFRNALFQDVQVNQKMASVISATHGTRHTEQPGLNENGTRPATPSGIQPIERRLQANLGYIVRGEFDSRACAIGSELKQAMEGNDQVAATYDRRLNDQIQRTMVRNTVSTQLALIKRLTDIGFPLRSDRATVSYGVRLWRELQGQYENS